MKVYVAGPITAPTHEEMVFNVERAMRVGCELMRLGYQAFVPHTSYYMHLFAEQSAIYVPTWENWMDLDLSMLRTFDALIRLSGQSKGADIEEAKAREWGIPVFHSIAEFLSWEERRP